MYRFVLTGTVPLRLQVAPQSTIDSMLFVFDSAGFAVVANDDQGTTTLDASITATLAPGSYFFAISSSNRRPVNAAGQEIFSNLGTALEAPINGGGPIAGYVGSGAIGSYVINTVGVAPIPEPSTTALLAAGFVALLGWRRAHTHVSASAAHRLRA